MSINIIIMEANIEIQNLKCGGCASSITKKIMKIEGISSVSVDVNVSTLSFEYLEDIQLQMVIKVLSEIGYPIAGEKNTISRKAKSYVSCAIGKIKN